MRCYHGLFAVEAHYGEGDCPQFCVRGPSFLLGLWYNVDVKFECFVTEVPLFSSWPIFAWNGCQFVCFITEVPLFYGLFDSGNVIKFTMCCSGTERRPAHGIDPTADRAVVPPISGSYLPASENSTPVQVHLNF